MSEEQKTDVQPVEPESTEVQPSETPQEAIPAVGFLVVAFVDENAADEALEEMKQAKKRNEFYFEDAAVIRQDVNGKVHYHETGDMSTGRGAGVGAIVGGILGVLGGPVGVAAGAGIGAAVGAGLAHHDAGFRNESLDTVGVALKPGTSAVAAITSNDFLKAIQKQVPKADLDAAVANLANNVSARLADNMNLAIGLVLTEKGLAVQEVAANAERSEVIGAVITDDVVAVGAAVATAEGVAYQVGVATAEGTAVETGVITDEGAYILDDVATAEGETLTATAAVPLMVTATETITIADDAAADAPEAAAAEDAAAADAPETPAEDAPEAAAEDAPA